METGLRILLVDDDPMSRIALEEIFRVNGMKTLAVGHARAALEGVASFHPDLCVLDTILPDSTGIELIASLRLKPELSRVGIVGMSARHDLNLLTAAFRAGADDFVFKPATAEELLLRGQLAVRRRREVSAVAPPAALIHQQRIRGPMELSVLYGDLRGLSAATANGGPMRLSEVLNPLADEIAAELQKYGGQFERLVGSGFLALFGAEAKGGGELSAVRAAVALRRLLKDGKHRATDVEPLDAGMGVSSGEVAIALVGTSAQQWPTAIGDPVDTAWRLSTQAASGEVLICERTAGCLSSSITGESRRVELRAGRPSTVMCVNAARAQFG